MKRFAISVALCLLVAACGGTVSAPQQAQAGGTSVSGGTSGAQINAIRAAANRPPLTRNATLDAAARSHAADMASGSFFAHKGSNGSLPDDRVTRAGYKWCTISENIAEGFRDSAVVIEGWRTSPGHHRNIVSAKAKEYGLANVDDVWVMVIAARKC